MQPCEAVLLGRAVKFKAEESKCSHVGQPLAQQRIERGQAGHYWLAGRMPEPT